MNGTHQEKQGRKPSLDLFDRFSRLRGQAVQGSSSKDSVRCLLPMHILSPSQWWESRRHRISTQQAVRLHETVNPDRRCITYFDLKFFESEVQRAIQGGLTFQENFDVSLGPSIYAVNEEYIKPVTAAAGKMSWALMMNPDGLDCDLFITHAWQESVLEFTQKGDILALECASCLVLHACKSPEFEYFRNDSVPHTYYRLLHLP